MRSPFQEPPELRGRRPSRLWHNTWLSDGVVMSLVDNNGRGGLAAGHGLWRHLRRRGGGFGVPSLVIAAPLGGAPARFQAQPVR